MDSNKNKPNPFIGSPGGPSVFGTNVYATPSGNNIVPAGIDDTSIIAGLLQDILNPGKKGDNEFATAKSSYINWLLTLNQRQYDENWRDNERQYSSPTAQLERLMATGMSYSAALALLQGSGELGTASGISQMTADTANAAADRSNDISAVDSAVNAASSLTNSALGLFNTYQGASSFGINLSLLQSQADAQNLANYQSRMYNQGLDIANDFMGLVHSAKNFSPLTDYTDPLSGQVSKRPEFDPTQYQSFDELLEGFAKYAVKYPAAAQFLNSGGLRQLEGNVYARQFAESMFNSRWQTAGVKNTGSQLLAAAKAAYVQNIAAQSAADITNEELTLLWQQVELNRPAVLESRGRLYAQYFAQSGNDVFASSHVAHSLGSSPFDDIIHTTDNNGVDTTGSSNPLIKSYIDEIHSYLIFAASLPYQSEQQVEYMREFLNNAVNDEQLRSHLIAIDTAFYNSVSPNDIPSGLSKFKILWDKLGAGELLSTALKAVPVVRDFVPKGTQQNERSAPAQPTPIKRVTTYY